MFTIDADVGGELKRAASALDTVVPDALARVKSVAESGIQPDFAGRMNEQAAASWRPRTAIALITRTALATVNGTSMTFFANRSAQPLSGGLRPTRDQRMFEFGTSQHRMKTYDRRNRAKGGTHKVTRVTNKQVPLRRRKGWVFYPTVEPMIPRYASLVAQTLVRTLMDTLEGRRR